MNSRTSAKSSAGLIVTAIACLMMGEKNLNLSPHWQPINKRQAQMLEIGAGYRTVILDGLLPIDTEFSPDSEVVNQFFRDHDISITLSPCGPDEYAMGAVMTIKVTWLLEGVETRVAIDGNGYVAAHIDCNYRTEGGPNMMFGRAAGHNADVVSLRTKEGYTVLLTKAPQHAGLSGPELFAEGLAIAQGLTEIVPNYAEGEKRYDGVEFPESVFNNVDVDMDYVVGLHTTQHGTGQNAEIIEAKGQFRGRIDRKGAEVVEAVGMVCALESFSEPEPPNPLVIDDRFLAIFIKEGVGPVSVLFVSEDSWQLAEGEVVTSNANAKLGDSALEGGSGEIAEHHFFE